MLREVLKSKIHRATVTDANLNYQGSITIDPSLMRLANLVPYEKVQVVDIQNGNRLETYAIEGRPESGEIIINGAAARLVMMGDMVIIMAFALMDEAELKNHKPSIVLVDAANRPTA